jgi:hypothetical protein
MVDPMSKTHKQTRNLIAPGMAFGLLFALSMPIVAGLGSAPAPAPQRATLDMTGWEDLTTTYTDLQHVPVPASAVNIGPGSHLLITMAGGTYGCTANFIWSGTNGKTYLGAAGHCYLPEGKTATHGPGADYNPALTTVKVCVASCNFGGETGFSITGQLVTLGPVAYARQTEGGADVGHDFGIVEIPTSQAARVRPSMPVWGGPIGTTTVGLGKVLCHYGNGVGVGEVFPTMGRMAVGMSGGAGISFTMNGAAAPGDSGSAVEGCGTDSGGVHGQGAAGILTHIGVSTGVVLGTTVAQAKTMATQAGLTISTVNGA